MISRELVRRGWAIGTWLVVLVLTIGTVVVDVAFESARLRPALERWTDVAALARGLVPLALATVGSLIALRQRANRVAHVLIGAALLLGVSAFAGPYGDFATVDHGYLVVSGRTIVPPAGALAAWMQPWTEVLGNGLVAVGLFLTFPTGGLPSRRWRPVALVAACAIGAHALLAAFGPAARFVPLGGRLALAHDLAVRIVVFGRPMQLLALVSIVMTSVAALALVSRYRVAAEEERLQLKWFLVAAAATALVHLAVPLVHFGGRLTTSAAVTLLVGTEAVFLLVPLAVAIAVFRYRLYDIDVVINKAIVVGGMSLFITLAYIGITSIIGRIAADDDPSVVVAALATGPVALGFAPLREKTQRLANRAVYGPRSEPYELLARFATALPHTVRADDVLAQAAAAVGVGLGAAQVEARLRLLDGGDRTEHWIASDAAIGTAAVGVDIELQGEHVGHIEVTKRRGEGVTREDHRLLRLLADYAAAALHNLRLTVELEDRQRQLELTTAAINASRRRLVRADLAARRRFETEIADGVIARLRPLDELVERARQEPAAAARVTLDDAISMCAEALDRLRRIAHGVHTPVVDELGLIAALQSHFRDIAAPETRITTKGGAPALDPVAASALYTCCVEIARVAASPLSITVRADDAAVEVRLSAASFDPRTELDEDLVHDLADRVEAAGGSFEITYESGRTGLVRAMVPVHL